MKDIFGETSCRQDLVSWLDTKVFTECSKFISSLIAGQGILVLGQYHGLAIIDFPFQVGPWVFFCSILNGSKAEKHAVNQVIENYMVNN